MLNKFSRKYPALITVIPLAAGILVSYFSGIKLTPLPEWIFITVLILLGAFTLLIYNKISKGEHFLFPYLLVLMLFGLFSFQYSYNKQDKNNIGNIAAGSTGNVKLIAVITEKPEVTDERIRLLLNVKSVNDSPAGGTIFASVYKNKFKEDFTRTYYYGDLIELNGRLEPLPFQRNPGEFNYGEYLKLHGVDAVMTSFGYENISITGHEDQNFFMENVIYPVKDYSITVVDNLVGGSEGEYLKGLLLGERSNIPRQLKEDFINAGVAHIIAVSGLNVAYVVLLIWGLLICIPVKHQVKIFITIAALFFYMVLTGSTPSIVRAVIMAVVFMVAQLAERKPNSYNIISFAALVILVIDPRQLFDAGFILSFSAILSLLIIYPVLENLTAKIKWFSSLDNNKVYVKFIRAVAALFTGTIAAQIGTLPVTALMFKKVSIVSLVSNLFAIPLSNISLALGFITVFSSVFSGWLAEVFASVNGFMLYWQLNLIRVSANFDFSFVHTYFVDVSFFAGYYIILILLLSASAKNITGRLIIILLITLNYFVWKDVSALTNEAEITYLYSGSSNSTLIKMPMGSSVMINCGSSSVKFNTAQRTVIPYLSSRGINSLDLLIINSLDKNEFRNLLYFVYNFNVSKIILPLYYKNVIESKRFAGNFKNTNIEYITSSKVMNKNGNFRIYIYYDSLLEGKSMMSQFVFGDQSFVFNDAVTPEEVIYNTVYLNNLDLNFQTLRVTGSGSFNTTPAELIASSVPEYVVIGETLTGRKKVNSEIFIQTLSELEYNVLNVGREGAVILKTNGDITRKVNWQFAGSEAAFTPSGKQSYYYLVGLCILL